MHQGCLGLDSQVNCWQLAWENKRNKTKALGKSADRLKMRLVDCQKRIGSHTVGKRQMGMLQETRSAASNSALAGIEERANDQGLKLELEHLRKTYEGLKHENDDQQAVASKLRTQVAEYRRLVAVYSREVDQLTDDRIKARFENLFHRIRNIAVRLCRATGFRECIRSQPLE